MEWREVKSSSMRRIGYEYHTHTMDIEFNSGRIYRYNGVPPEIVNNLLNAGSKGEYFAAHVVGKYPYRCLNPKPAKGDQNAQTKRKREIRKALEADPPKKIRIS